MNLNLNTSNLLGVSSGERCADERLPVVCHAIICLENTRSTFPFKSKYNPYLITE